jgi:hypothetical protein
MSEKSDALAVPIDVTMRRPTLFGVLSNNRLQRTVRCAARR